MLEELQVKVTNPRTYRFWTQNGPARRSGLVDGERWLTAYTAYYNQYRSHQALENQPPIEALELEGSI